MTREIGKGTKLHVLLTVLIEGCEASSAYLDQVQSRSDQNIKTSDTGRRKNVGKTGGKMRLS
jgi:hypothetical protein